MRRNFAELTGQPINWAAGLTWFLTMAICTSLVWWGGMQIYFVSLPGWFIAALLYGVLSRLNQPRAVSAVRAHSTTF